MATAAGARRRTPALASRSITASSARCPPIGMEFNAYRYEFHDDFSAEMSVDAGSIKVVIKDGDKEPLDVTDAFRVEVVGHGLSVSSVDLKAAAPAVSKNGKVILTFRASIVPDGATAGTGASKEELRPYRVHGAGWDEGRGKRRHGEEQKEDRRDRLHLGP